MQVTINKPVPVPTPPPTYTLELTEVELHRVQTALYLMAHQDKDRLSPFHVYEVEQGEARTIFDSIHRVTNIG